MSCQLNVGSQIVRIAPASMAGGTKRIVVDVGPAPESQTNPVACTAAGGGTTTAQPDTKAFFSLRMLDYAGKPRRTGGDPIMLAVGRGDAVDRTVATTIADNGNGTYSCSYTLPRQAAGAVWILSVRLFGQHVAGSPFSVDVGTRATIKCDDFVSVRMHHPLIVNDSVDDSASSDDEAFYDRAFGMVTSVEGDMCTLVWFYSHYDEHTKFFPPAIKTKMGKRLRARISRVYASAHEDDVDLAACMVVPDVADVYADKIFNNADGTWFGNWQTVADVRKSRAEVERVMHANHVSHPTAVDHVVAARFGIFSAVDTLTASVGVVATELMKPNKFPTYACIGRAAATLKLTWA